jgi:hypothetical protein
MYNTGVKVEPIFTLLLKHRNAIKKILNKRAGK